MSNRETALQQLANQHERTPPITLEALKEMVEQRKTIGITDGEIEELVKSVTPGTTRAYYFMLEQDGQPLSIMKVLADSVEQAMEKLDNIGKLVDAGSGDIPRLHKWR